MANARTANAEQHEHWNGPEAQHWVAYNKRYDAALARFGHHLLNAANIAPADRVLDVGCGCGATTLDAARRAPAGSAVGLDLSSPMLELARHRASEQDVANARFDQGDAQTYVLAQGGIDVAISRFGVMFFDDPVAAFANIGRALRASGRLAFVCWQDLLANEWIAVPAGAALAHVPMPDLGEPGSPGAFAFADPDRIHAVLRDAGFADVHIDAVSEPLAIGETIDDAMTFLADTDIAHTVFERAEPTAVENALVAIREALIPYAADDGVALRGAAWLVRATRPADRG